MVERYLFVKLRPEHATPAGRKEAREHAAALRGLPGLTEVVIGTPADADALHAWDLSVTLCAHDLAALEGALSTQAHARFVGEYLGPRAIVVKNWSFVVERS